MRVIRRALGAAAALLLLLSGCGQQADNAPNESATIVPAPADAAEQACLSFVQTQLTVQGGIYTNYLSGSAQGALAGGHEVLGESQGLMLRYYAAIADAHGFSQTLGFITRTLDTDVLLSYRAREDGSPYAINASIDDLRILRGLLEGARVFSNPAYQALCENWAKRLYQTNVQDGMLLDCYDETLVFAGSVSTLCFSDLETLRLLGKVDRRWGNVEKNMRRILQRGYLGDDFPFYQTRYNLESQAYETEHVNMVEALLTALHLSEVGEGSSATLRWVKTALAQGAIYGAYTPQGIPVNQIESTAIYALCALLGDAESDQALVNAAIEKLRTLQITDKQSALYGAFADAATQQAYSFDNLMALAALRAQAQKAASNEKG